MLMPKRVKYRKQMRGRMRGNTKGGSQVAFGEYGLKALERGWITNRQIEAARVAMTRKIKRGGKVWINIFPDKPYTKKPAETRMGSGKGNPEGWVAVVKPGPGDVRARRRRRGARQGGDAPRRPQASDQDQVRHAARGRRSEGLRRARARRPGAGRSALKEAREEAFNLRFRHATGELENTAAAAAARGATSPGC